MSAETLGWWLLGWVGIALLCGIAWCIAFAPRRDRLDDDLDTSPCPYGFHNTLCGACGVCACNPSACPDCWGCHTAGCVGHCVGHEVTA